MIKLHGQVTHYMTITLHMKILPTAFGMHCEPGGFQGDPKLLKMCTQIIRML